MPGTLVATTATAADGTYSVGGLPPGQYIVVADGSAIGFSTAQQTVDVISGSSTTADFQLQAAPGTLTVTVVTGTPAGHDAAGWSLGRRQAGRANHPDRDD